MMTDTTRALVARLAELLSSERTALADFIAMLADFDRERRWVEAGYANLFDFLVRELRMSRGTAFYRKTTVELVQQYPEVLDALRDGRLCITAVHALSRAITPEHRAEVLPLFFHVSKLQAKVISAELAPAVDVPRRDVVTAARAAPALDLGHDANRLARRAVTAFSWPSSSADASARTATMPEPTLALAPPLVSRTTIDPLTAQDHRLHLTVTPEFLQLLDACRMRSRTRCPVPTPPPSCRKA